MQYYTRNQPPVSYNDDLRYKSWGIDISEEITSPSEDSDPDYVGVTVQEKALNYMQNQPKKKYTKDNHLGVVQVKINMQGSRSLDKQEYIKRGGIFPSGPYELHHNADMDDQGEGTCTMIALPKDYHNSKKPHWGAVCQYHAKYGRGY